MEIKLSKYIRKSNEIKLRKLLHDISDEEKNISMIKIDALTLLSIAAISGDIRIIKCLVEFGALVNITNTDGTNALYWACYYYRITSDDKKRNAYFEIIKYLIELGSDCSSKSVIYNGYTCLMQICASTIPARISMPARISQPTIDIIKLLLDNGADKRAVSSGNKTAAMIAAMNGDHSIEELINSHKVDSNHMDKVPVKEQSQSQSNVLATESIKPDDTLEIMQTQPTVQSTDSLTDPLTVPSTDPLTDPLSTPSRPKYTLIDLSQAQGRIYRDHSSIPSTKQESNDPNMKFLDMKKELENEIEIAKLRYQLAVINREIAEQETLIAANMTLVGQSRLELKNLEL